jgi:hypothetical protein
MFRFYNVLKERPADQPITQEEIDIASGKKTMDPEKVTEYVKNLEVMSENIIRAFEKQGVAAAVCGPS